VSSGDRVYAELSKFIRAVQDDQQHDVRIALDKYLKDLAQDLQYSPEPSPRPRRSRASCSTTRGSAT
jgi:uncharacterized membrane-anchored protein YjiN (DUF445 family)